MELISSVRSQELLNQARAMELKGIIQYMQAHYILEDMAYSALADSVKDIAIEEMHHAEYMAQRILEFDGTPVKTPTDTNYETAKNASMQYVSMLELEKDTVQAYEDICTALAENKDHVSAQLMKKIIVQEEQHLQYFSDTAKHIAELGDNFLSRMADRKFSPSEYSAFITKGKL